MKLLSGTEIVNNRKEQLKEYLKDKKEITLCCVVVGENPASLSYVKNKTKLCADVGIKSVVEQLPENISEHELLRTIHLLNDISYINGIIVQLPLPKHINEQRVIAAINPEKDVDGFHPINMGKCMLELKTLLPATPKGILSMIDYYGIETTGKKVVVVGRSNIVGKPIASLLSSKKYNATVTLCHSKTKNLKEECLSADIIIAAIGIPDFIKKEMVKEGAVIIDVGINRIFDETLNKYKLKGDVDFNDVQNKVSAITPVPGGVGPMTVLSLIENVIQTTHTY